VGPVQRSRLEVRIIKIEVRPAAVSPCSSKARSSSQTHESKCAIALLADYPDHYSRPLKGKTGGYRVSESGTIGSYTASRRKFPLSFSDILSREMS